MSHDDSHQPSVFSLLFARASFKVSLGAYAPNRQDPTEMQPASPSSRHKVHDFSCVACFFRRDST